MGADDCIGVASLERDVTRRLGYDPFAGEAQQWLEGIVVAEGGQYRAVLFERDSAGKGLGRREIVDGTGSCAQLSEAISLAVALIIDPNAQLRPLETPAPDGASTHAPKVALATAPDGASPATALVTAPSAATPSPSAAPLTCPPPPSDPALDRADTNPSLWLLPGLRWGIFPELTPTVEFAVEAEFGSTRGLSYRLGVVYLPENKVKDDLATLSYGLTAGLVELCAGNTGKVRAFGCLGLEGGALHTVVHDPDPDEPGERLWLAGRGSLGGEVTLLGPLSLQLRLLAAVPVLPWTFHVTVDGTRHQLFSQRFWELGGALGLGLRFF